MAFTYAVVKVATLTTGTQVVGVLAADGHGYVYPTPAAGSGLAYPTTVRTITAQNASTPGAGATDGTWQVYLNNSSPYALPTDFNINDVTDWVITATGTA